MISHLLVLATEADLMEKLACVQQSQNLIDVLRIALSWDIGGPKNTGQYQGVSSRSESRTAATIPRDA